MRDEHVDYEGRKWKTGRWDVSKRVTNEIKSVKRCL